MNVSFFLSRKLPGILWGAIKTNKRSLLIPKVIFQRPVEKALIKSYLENNPRFYYSYLWELTQLPTPHGKISIVRRVKEAQELLDCKKTLTIMYRNHLVRKDFSGTTSPNPGSKVVNKGPSLRKRWMVTCGSQKFIGRGAAKNPYSPRNHKV